MKDIKHVILNYRNRQTVTFGKYETNGEEMHHHDMYQIEFISAGKGTLKLNNKEYPAKRGLMYAVRLRDYHAFEVSETLTVHRIILPLKCMPEKMSYGMLKSKVDIITRLDEEPSKHVENLFLMLESRGKAWLNNEIYIQEWLINIIVTEFFERVKFKPEDVYVSDAEKLEKVMLYIQDNFRRKLTIAEVADHFKMNASYLNRIFKEQKGTTLYAAVKSARLEYAKKLLVDTNLSIADVCKTCGYSDSANLLRDFKKLTGVAPLRFRKLKGVVNDSDKDED
ncbi:MAG: helix-turn-helix domain-containing protein [Clostridia bacterium]|nr:helix-turn-helix domain-containing protein [Clostridia bacterium]